jgi:hypothetical protein
MDKEILVGCLNSYLGRYNIDEDITRDQFSLDELINFLKLFRDIEKEAKEQINSKVREDIKLLLEIDDKPWYTAISQCKDGNLITREKELEKEIQELKDKLEDYRRYYSASP